MMNQIEMNNMNNFNPMMNQNFAINNNQLQQLMQQQLMQMQQMMQQQQMQQEMQMNQQMNDFQKQEEISNNINLHFRKDLDNYSVQCHLNEKISKVIERYRNMASDFKETEKFIFNAKALNPSLTVIEAGLNDGALIFVVETKGVRGG